MELNATTFEELKKTTDLVIVDFWATWCPPCKVMGPIFEEFATQSEFANLKFIKCDVDNNPEISGLFDISSIPTFAVIKFNGNGGYELVDSIVGAYEKEVFHKMITEIVAKSNSKSSNVLNLDDAKPEINVNPKAA